MMRLHRPRLDVLLAALATIALAAPLAACGEVTDGLSLSVIKADPTTLKDVDTIRVHALDDRGDDVLPPLDLLPGVGSQGQFGDLLPTAGQVRFLVEGLSGSTVVARGGSGYVTLGDGDLDVTVVLGRVGTFHDTLGADGEPTELPFPLSGASATRLKDGRVLIVGGASLDTTGAITDVSNRALIYDPNTGGFTELSSELRIRRAFHTATLLKAATPGGPQRVLIAGGITVISGERIESTRLAEIFDPETLTFTGQLLEMQRARYGHTATLLVSGNVLLAGGGELVTGQLLSQRLGVDDLQIAEIHADADLFLFSETTPSFATTPPAMAEPRMFHVAGRGSGDAVLVAGGQSATAVYASTEIYDPNAGTFSAGADLAVPRTFASLTRLPGSGALLIAGGLTQYGTLSSATNSVELYTLDTATSSTRELDTSSRLGSARWRHQAVLMSDNQRVLMVGGQNGSGFTLQSAELVGDGIQTEVINEGAARIHHSAVRLLSGGVLVLGGVERPTSGGVQPELGGTIYTPTLVGD